jgi:hypothetical protein
LVAPHDNKPRLPILIVAAYNVKDRVHRLSACLCELAVRVNGYGYFVGPRHFNLDLSMWTEALSRFAAYMENDYLAFDFPEVPPFEQMQPLVQFGSCRPRVQKWRRPFVGAANQLEIKSDILAFGVRDECRANDQQ